MLQLKISKVWFIVVGLALILLLIVVHTFKMERKYKEQVSINKSLSDTLTVTKNKLGQSVAHASVVEATNVKNFLEIQNLQGTNKELQDLVKSETNKKHDVEVALIYKDSLIMHLRDSLNNTISGQTVIHKGDSTFIYPIYYKQISNEWINEDIKLGKSTFNQTILLTNDYKIVIGEEKDGVFKKKRFAEVTPINPYVTPNTLKVYEKVSVPNKALKLGTTTLVVGFIAGLLIHLL